MNLQELAQISVPVTAADNALKVGASNKVMLSEKAAKLKLEYQEGDEFLILEVTGDYEGLAVGCVPEGIVAHSKKFNKGTFAFGDKDVANVLGGIGSEWDLEVLFNTLDLPNGRKCPLYAIEQKIKGEDKQKELTDRYEKAETIKKEVKQSLNITPSNEIKDLENQFESEAPELENSTTVNNEDYNL